MDVQHCHTINKHLAAILMASLKWDVSAALTSTGTSSDNYFLFLAWPPRALAQWLKR